MGHWRKDNPECSVFWTWDWERKDWWCSVDGEPAPPSPPEPETPRIVKPSWLSDILASSILNFDIFTWHIGIGEWLEKVADWIIDRINEVIDWATDIWKKANAAWDKAVEVGKSIPTLINQALASVWKAINSIPDTISKAIDALKPWVDGLVKSAISSISNIINWLEDSLYDLRAKWDNFAQNILPDINKLLLIIFPWLGAIEGVIQLVQGWEEFMNDLREFWNDPEKWLLDKITNMLERFI